ILPQPCLARTTGRPAARLQMVVIRSADPQEPPNHALPPDHLPKRLILISLPLLFQLAVIVIAMFMSGREATTDDPREVQRCYELGCSVYITKPVTYDQFIEAIKRLGLFLAIVKVPREDERA